MSTISSIRSAAHPFDLSDVLPFFLASFLFQLALDFIFVLLFDVLRLISECTSLHLRPLYLCLPLPLVFFKAFVRYFRCPSPFFSLLSPPHSLFSSPLFSFLTPDLFFIFPFLRALDLPEGLFYLYMQQLVGLLDIFPVSSCYDFYLSNASFSCRRSLYIC